MARNGSVLVGVVLALLAAGCVEHRYVITSDPAGAAVYRNGEYIGNTPVDDTFVYYGNYHYTLRKDGYQTLQVDQKIPAPWYEVWPLEFVSEVLVPNHIEDVHYFYYTLQPLQQPSIPDLLNRGQTLRNEGATLHSKNPPPTPNPTPAAPAPVPATTETP